MSYSVSRWLRAGSVLVAGVSTAASAQFLPVPSDALVADAYLEDTYVFVELESGFDPEAVAPHELPLVTDREPVRYAVVEYIDVNGDYRVLRESLTPRANLDGSMHRFARSESGPDGLRLFDADGALVHAFPASEAQAASSAAIRDVFAETGDLPRVSVSAPTADALDAARAAGIDVQESGSRTSFRSATLATVYDHELLTVETSGDDPVDGTHFQLFERYEVGDLADGQGRLSFSTRSEASQLASGVCVTTTTVTVRTYAESGPVSEGRVRAELDIAWQRDALEDSPTRLRLSLPAELRDGPPVTTRLYDIRGVEVRGFTGLADGVYIDVSDLLPGSYVLATEFRGAIHTQLFIK